MCNFSEGFQNCPVSPGIGRKDADGQTCGGLHYRGAVHVMRCSAAVCGWWLKPIVRSIFWVVLTWSYMYFQSVTDCRIWGYLGLASSCCIEGTPAGYEPTAVICCYHKPCDQIFHNTIAMLQKYAIFTSGMSDILHLLFTDFHTVAISGIWTSKHPLTQHSTGWDQAGAHHLLGKGWSPSWSFCCDCNCF